jgi:hypothetical protein
MCFLICKEALFNLRSSFPDGYPYFDIIDNSGYPLVRSSVILFITTIGWPGEFFNQISLVINYLLDHYLWYTKASV